jgi:hypothetical protein
MSEVWTLQRLGQLQKDWFDIYSDITMLPNLAKRHLHQSRVAFAPPFDTPIATHDSVLIVQTRHNRNGLEQSGVGDGHMDKDKDGDGDGNKEDASNMEVYS